MSIPLVDLKLQHGAIADDVADGFARVLERTAFILGDEVARFEADYAAYLGARHCVAVANGTDAIELMLRGLGIGSGDEVILPANTFVATALGVIRAGAAPVLVDSDPDFHLIDPERIEERITERTRAILAVHLFGQTAPMEKVRAIARRHGILALEDAAQSQGARRRDKAAGTLGAAAATSFYPGKNLGAYGDAGAVMTGSSKLASKVRRLRNYGSERKYYHPEIGFNSRLDTLQAVVLGAKLKRLESWNEQRRAAADRYAELLADAPAVRLPATLRGNLHVWHLYVVRVPRRDRVVRAMQAAGIGVGIHYPIPIHRLGAFGFLGHRRGSFPVAERAAREILSLPMYPGITDEQQEEVARALRAATETS